MQLDMNIKETTDCFFFFLALEEPLQIGGALQQTRGYTWYCIFLYEKKKEKNRFLSIHACEGRGDE